MLKKLVFVGMILVLMVSFSVVLADQDGNTCWCNVDKDGCWVTNEEGGRDYLMFWSEASRKFFMGDITAPYTNVVSMADGARLGLLCGLPEPEAAPKTIESICKQWVDEEWAAISKHYQTKESAVTACSGAYTSVEEAEDAYNNRNSVNKNVR